MINAEISIDYGKKIKRTFFNLMHFLLASRGASPIGMILKTLNITAFADIAESAFQPQNEKSSQKKPMRKIIEKQLKIG